MNRVTLKGKRAALHWVAFRFQSVFHLCFYPKRHKLQENAKFRIFHLSKGSCDKSIIEQWETVCCSHKILQCQEKEILNLCFDGFLALYCTDSGPLLWPDLNHMCARMHVILIISSC